MVVIRRDLKPPSAEGVGAGKAKGAGKAGGAGGAGKARKAKGAYKAKVAKKEASGKVNKRLLYALLDRGLTPKEIADQMGASVSAVRYHIKNRQRKATELVVVSEARPVVERQLNTIDQLNRINESANKMLDKALAGIKALEGIEMEGLTPDEAIEAMRLITQGRDMALKAMGEIRMQLKLQLEIFQALYDVRAAEEFQQEVLNAIGEVDEPTRNRILDRLRQRRAVRQVVQRA